MVTITAKTGLLFLQLWLLLAMKQLSPHHLYRLLVFL